MKTTWQVDSVGKRTKNDFAQIVGVAAYLVETFPAHESKARVSAK
jgi:hypothetical protein